MTPAFFAAQTQASARENAAQVIKPVRQRPQAAADIAAIADYMRKDSRVAALKFVDAVEAAYELLSSHPAGGSTRHAALLPELPAPLRFHPIKGFERILIYYFDLSKAVGVIRVWDAARGLEALIADEP
ncbi:MAG: type II toxin-antitoxin system RelE/ParE family toxin [Rhodanobacteraceae bacterium]